MESLQNKPQYWQVAAGNDNRDYSSLFLKHGLAFVGGDEKVAVAQRVRAGDVMILKVGMKAIRAAGRVVIRQGKFRGLNDRPWTRDIQGWDLRAYVYVDWVEPAKPIPAPGLTRQTICLTHSEEHWRIADGLLKGRPKSIVLEPPEPTWLEIPELVTVASSVNSSIDKPGLTSLMEGFARVHRHEDPYIEMDADETRDQLVTPLLRALGWGEGELVPRVSANYARHIVQAMPAGSVLPTDLKLIDVRHSGHGLDLPAEQAAQIANIFQNAKSVATTNGHCYMLYRRRSDDRSFEIEPSGYANLSFPAAHCPWEPAVLGAKTVLKWLTRREG